MQIPTVFDFRTALNIAGFVIIIILAISLLIFGNRLREIYDDLGISTRRALMAYPISGIAMMLATLVGVEPPLRFIITGTGALFLGAIIIAEMWILLSEKRARQGTLITVLIVVGVYANNFMDHFMGIPEYFMMFGLTILLVGSLYFALVLVRENPSTFSASLLMVLILYMSTWIIAATGWIFDHPQYYIVQVIPLLVAATVFSSIRKPWRTTISTFIAIFSVTIGTPIIITSLTIGSWTIFFFVCTEIITAICLIAPLNYFLNQATETGARMPLYLGAVVALVSLLVSTHALSWSVFISNTPALTWDPYIVWADVIIGACAIIAFMLAGVSSLYGEWAQTFTREAMIIFGTAAAFLTFPETQPLGFTNDLVWMAIGGVIVIGTLLFIRLSIKIARAGGGGAARRLMMFIVSALMIAVVSMYSDRIPPTPPAVPIVAILILLIAGSIAVLSSPPVAARLSRTVKQLDELSELGVEEDGSIKLQ
jgi:hypothetical protein